MCVYIIFILYDYYTFAYYMFAIVCFLIGFHRETRWSVPGPALGAREWQTLCNSSASDDDKSPSTLRWCFFETLQQVTGKFFAANIYVHRFEMLRETFLGPGLKPVDAKDDVEKYFLQFGPIRDCYMPACQLREQHGHFVFLQILILVQRDFRCVFGIDANFVKHVTRE